MKATAIAAAFEKVGYSQAEMAFFPHAVQFLKSGGTFERAVEVLRKAAKSLGKEGQDLDVRKDQCNNADLSHPMPGEGQGLIAASCGLVGGAVARQPIASGGGQYNDGQDARVIDASPAREPSLSHPMPGEGQVLNAASCGHGRIAVARQPIASGGGQNLAGQDAPSAAAVPAREPSAAYLHAAGESRKEAARNILYRYKTSTGQWWGDVHPYEVGSMMRDSIRGQALMSACGPLNSDQMKMTFARLLKPEQAHLAMEKADKEIVNVG